MERLKPTSLNIGQYARRGFADFTVALPYGVYTSSTDEQPVNPIKAAPLYEPNGGFVFFGCPVQQDDFFGLCRVLGIPSVRAGEYAATIVRADDPLEEGYLFQMRLSRREVDRPQQELTMAEAMFAFIENQQEEWGTSFTDHRLRGAAGGDGDFAKEELAFGLMIENDSFGIYRIWSRAWLVTK